MGVRFNIPKSHLVPSTSLVYLGLVWDTVKGTVSLSPDNQARCRRKVFRAAHSVSLSGRQWESLVGSLNHAAGVVPLGRLHLRELLLVGRGVFRGGSAMCLAPFLVPSASVSVGGSPVVFVRRLPGLLPPRVGLSRPTRRTRGGATSRRWATRGRGVGRWLGGVATSTCGSCAWCTWPFVGRRQSGPGASTCIRTTWRRFTASTVRALRGPRLSSVCPFGSSGWRSDGGFTSGRFTLPG